MEKISNFLLWASRVMGIALTVFYMIFVFTAHGIAYTSLTESIIWLVLLVILIIAWRWQGAGGLLYLLLALLYITMTLDNLSALSVLITCGPLALTGLLFIMSKYIK